MTITNLTNIKNGALIAVANPVPFSIVVDSQQSSRVSLSIIDDNSHSYVATGIEMLKYRTEGTFQYFVCDLHNILVSTFDDINDHLQGAYSWRNMVEMLNDVSLIVTATDTSSQTETVTISFTIANVSRQFSEDICICNSPDNIYDVCKLETIYVGKGNIGYIYVFTNPVDKVGLTEDDRMFFVDYDDVYLCDYNDSLFFEK